VLCTTLTKFCINKPKTKRSIFNVLPHAHGKVAAKFLKIQTIVQKYISFTQTNIILFIGYLKPKRFIVYLIVTDFLIHDLHLNILLANLYNL